MKEFFSLKINFSNRRKNLIFILLFGTFLTKFLCDYYINPHVAIFTFIVMYSGMLGFYINNFLNEPLIDDLMDLNKRQLKLNQELINLNEDLLY